MMGEGLGGQRSARVLSVCEGSAFLPGPGALGPHRLTCAQDHFMRTVGSRQGLAGGSGQSEEVGTRTVQVGVVSLQHLNLSCSSALHDLEVFSGS